MDSEKVQDVEKKENPQVDMDERETETLLGLIKEATELSRIAASVNMAYIKAKSVEKVSQGYHEMGKAIDEKVTSTVGSIKENSKLYDEIKTKKAEICEKYGFMVEVVTEHYDDSIKALLSKKAMLEAQNMTLAADNQNLKSEKKEKLQEYKKEEKTQKNSDINIVIAQKKAEAEKLARSGDIDAAQTAIEEYKKLKESQVKETTGGMMEIATIAQQIRLNSEQFKQNKQEINDIEQEVAKLELEKEEKIEKVCNIQDKEMTKVDEKTSIFKKIAIFASKAITKTFNKGKAINDQVFIPMKNKIELQLPIIEESIGTKISDTKSKVTESFRDKVNKAIEFGKGVRTGAINKLKQRNDKKRENIIDKNQYLEDRDEK